MVFSKYIHFYYKKVKHNNLNICWFLVNAKIAPSFQRAKFLCEKKKIKINFKNIKSDTAVRKFDIINFNIRKLLFWFKLRRFNIFTKKGNKYKCNKGLIFNRKLNTFILYSDKHAPKTKFPNLFNYYNRRILIE